MFEQRRIVASQKLKTLGLRNRCTTHPRPTLCKQSSSLAPKYCWTGLRTALARWLRPALFFKAAMRSARRASDRPCRDLLSEGYKKKMWSQILHSVKIISRKMIPPLFLFSFFFSTAMPWYFTPCPLCQNVPTSPAALRY